MIRILIVDDRILICQALAACSGALNGLEIVATAGTVAEAIRSAEALQPDVVLMSVLEEVGMFDGAAAIVGCSPHIKLVVLDDVSQDSHIRETLRIGAAGYLTKQQPVSEIEAAIKRIARGDRVYAPDVARRLVLTADGVRLMVDPQSNPLARLTSRETDVLIHLAQGSSVKQCAKALGIGVSTVGNHKSRMMKKLDIHKTVELARLAVREGLIHDRRTNGQRTSECLPIPH